MSVCGICGGMTLTPLFTAGDVNFKTTDEIFLIERCATCGVAQTSPRPADTDLGRYYPPVYYPIGSFDEERYERTIGRFQHDKLELLPPEKRGGKVLDIGCGAGYFVREARKAGYDAEGVEFSAEAADFGRRAWNLPITVGNAQDVGFTGKSFDVVTLWHVLEHLSRPAEMLATVHRLLRPDGVLILTVPNFASRQAQFFKADWYHLEVPRHLYHFDPESLGRLLAKQGFRVDRVTHDSAEHNWAGILGSIMPLVPGRNSIAGRAARMLVVRPVARALAAVETALRSGGTFGVIARKS
jgi:2-polyprenyl-3-methyl-5-hydroxy-6-metoxy-1,4-benzoquinol methylase